MSAAFEDDKDIGSLTSLAGKRKHATNIGLAALWVGLKAWWAKWFLWTISTETSSLATAEAASLAATEATADATTAKAATAADATTSEAALAWVILLCCTTVSIW